ncbi:MAG: argininosuccinate lyase [bacterium]
MAKKLWGGRFSQKTLDEVDAFNASVGFDYQLWAYDIEGSIAHVRMLGRQKIIPKRDAQLIEKGLKSIAKDIAAGRFHWRVDQEDVHLNIEAELIRRIGAAGGKLHIARSRNDQVALDLRLYCRDHVHKVQRRLVEFQRSLLRLANRYAKTVMPGYTHLQRGQPVLLAHHLLAYFEMTERDKARLTDLLKRVETLPLGSGALAGTTFPIDRAFVAKQVGFPHLTANSLDAVSDRDFVLEILSACSTIMVHLSRFAEELILWSTLEFDFVQLPEGYCTGSSMMPQKMNPDVLELIRGKAGRVFGHLSGFLTVMKGLPLAYNKDMQEDKEPLFDAVDTTLTCLHLFAGLLAETSFKEINLKKATQDGFVLATDLADYLAHKGIPFREAHHIVGRIVRYCQEAHTVLEELPLEILKKFSKRIEKDVANWLKISAAVDRRKSYGGTASDQVKSQIRRAEKLLSKS